MDGVHITADAVVAPGPTSATKAVVTIFPNNLASTKREVVLSLDELANLIFVKRRTKESCELLKLATFGNSRTDDNCLRHNANITAITGVEVDYDGGVIPYTEARERLAKHGASRLQNQSHHRGGVEDRG